MTAPANTMPKRIGLVLVGLERANLTALRFLILQANSLQRTFEFEFLPLIRDKFLTELESRKVLDRQLVRRDASRFAEDYGAFPMPDPIALL
jgi:hypothetical protein